MITAVEARELVSASEAIINRYLEAASLLIAEVAAIGGCQLKLYDGFPWSAEPVVNIVIPTNQQQLIISGLQALGFTCTLEQDSEFYVPTELAAESGEGPLYSNHVITVSW